MTTARDRYLFIRILEACNADCFMCGFALSRDRYRFTPADFNALLPEAEALGVKYVRFTGGEPLMHGDIEELTRIGSDAGMRMSIISNGHGLERMAKDLVAAGLQQIIVSIDGASATTHDAIRNTDGLFDRAVTGLEACGALGIRTRVNTVVGPHNFTELPELQRLLGTLGVDQWELSALKLNQTITYPDPAEALAVGRTIYSGEGLQPMGTPWYGTTPEEQDRYFLHGIPPRAAAPQCHVTDDVLYLDPKHSDLMPCSLLPHRLVTKEDRPDGSEVALLPVERYREFQAHYREQGPHICTGCSATAAGYSNTIAEQGTVAAWAY